MSTHALLDLSNQFADAIAAAAASVVQVHGRRQPASGVVHSPNVVVTTTRAIGRDDGLSVKSPDGRVLSAELAGWDPATHLVALRVPELNVPAAQIATVAPRVGHLAAAVARSWSNALTASAGLISVIGGPLPTGRGRSIEEIIRTTAPMHRGFAGGAFIDTSGALLGISTTAEIRGSGVVIPAGIAWKTVDTLLTHGHAKRRYLGVAGQAVQLGAGQRPASGQSTAVLVVQVKDDSAAAKAGLLVGDLLIGLDDQALESPDRLLDALATGNAATATLKVLRGSSTLDVPVNFG